MPDNGVTPDEVAVPLAWTDLDDLDTPLANQFASLFLEEMFVVTVGNVTPPVFLGSEQARKEQAQELPYLPIRPIARFAMTEAKLEAFIDVLQGNLKRYREMKAAE